ncbi:MAG TPA: mechanosensitive ion channel domain-containing protein [Dehalococcoidia bacterium]|nr:mechanosensitive ion channel domain-containing protein [Dehalococcoidia bacterium]
MRRTTIATVIGILVIALVFGVLIMPVFRPNLAVYVTVVALSFAVALQRYVASFAGYFVLRFSKLFTVGDRIRVGNLNIKGDVHHIGLLHFTLDEVGEGERSGGELTGRILHIPNHVVLDQHVLNYSQGFTTKGKFISCNYVFDEVRVPLSKGVKVDRGRTLLEEILRQEDHAFVEKAKESFGKDIPNFFEEATHSPRVMIFTDTSNIWLVGRFVAPIRGRNYLRSLITIRFLEAMENETSAVTDLSLYRSAEPSNATSHSCSP